MVGLEFCVQILSTPQIIATFESDLVPFKKDASQLENGREFLSLVHLIGNCK